MSCGVSRRHSSDLALLWLWYRLAVAAPIQTLAWKLPHAVGVTLVKKKKKVMKEAHKKYSSSNPFFMVVGFSPQLGNFIGNLVTELPLSIRFV